MITPSSSRSHILAAHAILDHMESESDLPLVPAEALAFRVACDQGLPYSASAIKAAATQITVSPLPPKVTTAPSLTHAPVLQVVPTSRAALAQLIRGPFCRPANNRVKKELLAALANRYRAEVMMSRLVQSAAITIGMLAVFIPMFLAVKYMGDSFFGAVTGITGSALGFGACWIGQACAYRAFPFTGEHRTRWLNAMTSAAVSPSEVSAWSQYPELAQTALAWMDSETGFLNGDREILAAQCKEREEKSTPNTQEIRVALTRAAAG